MCPTRTVFYKLLVHLHLYSSYLLGYMYNNNVCCLYIWLLGVSMNTIQLSTSNEDCILLGYDTMSLDNDFLTFWRNIMPLSSTALSSRPNETFRTGCVTKYNLVKTCMYTIDTGFSWFPCVFKQMLRWFPSFQVATTCFSCSPPDLNFLVTFPSPSIFVYM